MLLIQLICAHVAYPQALRIAVAANAQQVVRKLQADFKQQTGISAEIIAGASGKLTAQIMNGAPYDIFLSADTAFPNQLYAKGFALQKPKIYAIGSLIICGNTTAELKNWPQLITAKSFTKIAVANPKTAPYGKAAEEALQYYGLQAKVASKVVYAESIAQVNTYLTTGTVAVGFTTESFLYENSGRAKMKWARVDPKSYRKIEQGAVLLSSASRSNRRAGEQFFNYLSSASARKIIAANGYHLPQPNQK